MAVLSPTIVRDPIHNYIPVSRLEKTLMDHPLFQRLKYITQNGLAYSVYPSNRTSRFIHSLGAMHVGASMLMEGLANTSEQDREAFLVQISRAIKECMDSVIADGANLTKHLQKLEDPFYRQHGLIPCENGKWRRRPDDLHTTYITIVLQSVRLACIMHDIGHFPFSHTVEHVLADYCRYREQNRRRQNTDQTDDCASVYRTIRSGHSKIALHEAIGTALTGKMCKEFPEELALSFARTCFALAKRIMDKKDKNPAVKSLGTIVSGTLDADRCDYVRRDGYASGFEFGDFDLQRILATLHFRRTKSDTWTLLPTTVAVSALESFFLERYRIHKWLIFHPMVVLSDLALSRALTILLEIYYHELTAQPSKEIEKILLKMKFNRLWAPLRKEDTYGELSACDEPWLLTLLQEVRLKLAEHGPFPDVRLVGLKAYLELVCLRKKGYFLPIWKRQEEYRNFCSSVMNGLRKRQKRPVMLENVVAGANMFIEDRVGKVESKRGNVGTMRWLEEEIQKKLPRKFSATGLVLKMLSFKPYEEYYVFDPATKKMVALSSISTIVRSLPSMWTEEVRVRPFVFTRRQNKDGYFILDDEAGHAHPHPSIFGKALAQVLEREKI